MLATSKIVLHRLPGIERPAIVTVLLTPSGPLVLCDAGANTEPNGRAARAGDHARRRLRSRGPRSVASAPRLALRNGAEPGKGTPATRGSPRAAVSRDRRISSSSRLRRRQRSVSRRRRRDRDRRLRTGNIVLGDACEGRSLEDRFGLARCCGSSRRDPDGPPRLLSLVGPALRGLAKRIDYTEIGGALLAGVTKPAGIAYGRSDATAIAEQDPRLLASPRRTCAPDAARHRAYCPRTAQAVKLTQPFARRADNPAQERI